MRPSSTDQAVFYSSQTAVSCASFRYAAFPNTQRTGFTFRHTGRVLRETIGPSAFLMYMLDLRPDLIKMTPDTIGTKTDCA
jgi:hypothetical protein